MRVLEDGGHSLRLTLSRIHSEDLGGPSVVKK